MKATSTRLPRSRPVSRRPAGTKKVQEQATAPIGWRNPWWVAFAAALLVAILFRLLFLDLKPLHHDEGVNGYLLTNLFRTGFYHYDPANYHGPTLYYFGLLTTTLNALFYGKAGLSTFAIRLVPAVFGIALVWLVFVLRPYLSNFGAQAAAALLAVSPGMVYFSRYFIHEIPFVFLTLALVVTVIWYHETAQPRYLMLAFASAALIFATKETCIISFAVLFLAWVCTRLYLWTRTGVNAFPLSFQPRPEAGAGLSRWRLPAMGLLVFIAISMLFYSSFFTNPRGVVDSLRTFQIWTHTGIHTDQYVAPRWKYLKWLWQEEAPIVVLGGLGTAVALWKARDRFAVFAAFWALGITAAYSLVTYKTPWLVLNLILPLGIMGGYFLSQWYSAGAAVGVDARYIFGISAVLALIAALIFCGYQAIDISFYRYDNDSVPYVYAHTSRQLLDLMDEVESIAARNPAGKNTGMTIASPEYWPLPWYLRDYPQAIFWGHMIRTSEPILIASGPQADEVEKTLGNLYSAYKTYDLRPGNVLILYLRRDIQP
ncbi:MAG TPA: flippase activity-associated protein Agl23 [Candidatus Acidoferrales bacterium]|nr:flippase activity-associated protein Agl23 [Candidatus Acidoferrales bacterium]